MKNTKKKLKGQSRVVKYSFNKIDVASSLRRIQASLVLHSFIATLTGNNITKYFKINVNINYYEKELFFYLHDISFLSFILRM